MLWEYFILPGNMFTTKWRASLYIDEKASNDQTQALTQIFGGQAGGASCHARLLSLVKLRESRMPRSNTLRVEKIAA